MNVKFDVMELTKQLADIFGSMHEYWTRLFF